MKRWGNVVAVVAILAAVATVAVVEHDRQRPAPAGAGELFALVDGDLLPGYATDVLVPDRRLRVTVTAPTADPSICCRGDGETRPLDERPPDGGTFVGVEVSVDPAGLSAARVAVLPAVRRPVPTYTLVVDLPSGRAEYPLGEDDPQPGEAAWVAVAGEPALGDLAVEVAYDGVVQSVDPLTRTVERGAAEPLYADPGREVVADCGRLRADPGMGLTGGDPTCEVTLRQTPYLPGEGWASDGAWLVATVAPLVDGARPGRAEVRLAGREPDLVTTDRFGPMGSTLVAWDVLDGTVDPDARLRTTVTAPADPADPDDGGRGGRTSSRATWTRTLPSLP